MFNPDYLEWDELGLKRVRCMRCWIPVIERKEVPYGKFIKIELKPLAHFQRVVKNLQGGA